MPLVAISFTTRCHLLSLVVTRCDFIATCCHSLSLVVTRYNTRCTTRCHSLLLVVPLVVIRCHSLSLDIPLVCLFIKDPSLLYNILFLHDFLAFAGILWKGYAWCDLYGFYVLDLYSFMLIKFLKYMI